jgi:hypothetical protein
MEKGLKLATAFVVGALSISAPVGESTNSKLEEVNGYPTEEVSGCAKLAHDRIMQVCDETMPCGDRLKREVESTIFTDCENGATLPEPGSVLDKCDLESLKGATRVYVKAGHLTGSFDERRDARYVRCLENSGLTKQDKVPAEVKRQPKEVLGSMSDLNSCKEQARDIISQICFTGNKKSILESLVMACMQSKQKVFKLMEDILRPQNECE